MITFEDFKKLDIRVGKVISVEKIPNADKLLKIIFDLGEEQRQIIAGIAEYYPNFEELIGKEMPIVVNLEPKYPASDSAADLAAVQRADAYFNRHFLDPIFLGAYPDELGEIFGSAWPEHSADDMALIREPIDFLGVNYYKRSVTCDDASVLPVRAGTVAQPQHVHTALDWEVFPAGLTRILQWLHGRYAGIPLYITENGAAFADPDTAAGGAVHDAQRIAYLHEHLLAAHAALAAGVDLRGYYVWSLLDNYEWAEGFSKRFGIVHVDFATLQRTPKSSAHFYSEVVRSNGAVLESSRDS